MELSSAIIGIVLLLISCIPFVIMIKNKSKKNKQFVQSLTNLAAEQNSTIHDYEICNNFIIGIDTEKNSLFFFKKTEKEEAKQTINLNTFQACNLIKQTRTVGDKKDNYTVIDRLALSFIPTPTNGSENEIEFYNSDKTIQLSGEFQAAEKWSTIITNHYKKSRVVIAN